MGDTASANKQFMKSIIKCHRAVLAQVIWVSIFLFWMRPCNLALAADLMPLPLQTLDLYIPTNIAGINSSLVKNGLRVTGWVNTNAMVFITATNSNFPGYTNIAHFSVLQRLIQAYQASDVQAVQELYDLSSRQRIATTLSDAGTRDRWSQLVANVQAIVPLVIWDETNRVAVLAHCPQGGGSNAFLLPFIFDRNSSLMATELKSPVASCLSIYFADRSRSPEGLLLTNNPGTNTAPLK